MPSLFRRRRWLLLLGLVLACLPTGRQVSSIDLERIYAAFPHEEATGYGGVPAIDVEAGGARYRVQCALLETRFHAAVSPEMHRYEGASAPGRNVGEDAFFMGPLSMPLEGALRFRRSNVITDVGRPPRTPAAPDEREQVEEIAAVLDRALLSHSSGVQSRPMLAAELVGHAVWFVLSVIVMLAIRRN